ncbi:lysostaphin resistance A-like protein [Amycolatopsis sp. cg5]|uniref:CPBP family intramembrane glutamic endopeptidase n=1 Tax=Amycolatopsis sp. cg5 TaxID=3238802 RepID=UPI003525010F
MDREPEQDVRAGLVLGAHWGFLAFFIGIGGYHLANLLIAVFFSGHFGGFDQLELHDVGPLLLVAFVPNLLLGLGPLIGSKLWGLGLVKDFGAVSLRDVKVGLACGGFALLAGYLANLVLIAVYGTERASENPLTDFSSEMGGSRLWLVLAALIVVLAAPLTEELLVRGALWSALDRYKIPQWVTLVLTAIVFAHLHGEPTRTVALFAQGIVIGLARYFTGNVSASVVAHAANNLPPALLLLGGN